MVIRSGARLVATCAIVAACAFAAWPSRAQQTKETTGVVLALDDGDVVIDLGKKAGLHDGSILELWRPLKLKNPATGKIVTDRFLIGSLKITQAGEVMSLARPSGPVSRAIAPGDIVITHTTVVTPAAPKPSTSTTPLPTPPMPPTVIEADPELREVGALFESLAGTSPDVRAAAYEKWVQAHPKSRFAGLLEEEAAALRGSGAKPVIATTTQPAPNAVNVVAFKKVEQALAGVSFTIALEVDGPVRSLILQLRTADEPAYSPIAFQRSGDHFWSATVPAARVKAPAISWFIEAVSDDGIAHPIVGNANESETTKIVAAPTVDRPLRHENVFSIWTDYASYNALKGNDYAWQTEGYFGMRFGDVGVRALRSGFGVYRGKGGGLDELDQLHLEARKVGLSYGYIEGEFGFDNFWSVIARAVVGLGFEEVKGGGQAFVRIGNDKRTNLLLGGEFLGGVGLRGISQLELAIFPRIPIIVRSEVTNQPAGARGKIDPTKQLATDTSDLGVRAIVQVGYRFVPGFELFVRGSYQGRTINHAGPGAGAGASVTW